MNKSLFIILIIIVVLVVATIYFNKNNYEVENVEYTDTYITFPDSYGKKIVTQNFLSDPAVKPDEQNEGMYTLGNEIKIDNSTGELPNYSVAYDKVEGSFNVILLKKPLANSRNAAEQYLQELLQIEQKELCGLSYMVTVPGYVDQEASGIDYRFSFCPGSTQL